MGRKWPRAARNIFSSLSDVAGDWFFWQFTVRDNPLLDKFQLWVFIFAVISSALGLLNLYVEISKCKVCRKSLGKLSRCGKICAVVNFNKALKAEIFIEDIPQLILSNLVRIELSGWTPSVAVNVTTSVLNMVFNIFDIAEDYGDVSEGSDMDGAQERQMEMSRNNNRSSGRVEAYAY